MGVPTESKRPLLSRCCSVCAFLSVALGVFFLLLGVWATHLKQRFTPVYSEIVCHMTPAKLKNFSFQGDLTLNLVSTTTCENPNPYSIELRSTRAEKVYMGSDMTPVASVTDIPPATLPAKGSGAVEANIQVRPTGDMIGSLFAGLFGATIPIYIENSMELVIDINFIFGEFKKTKAVDMDCGQNFKVDVLRRDVKAGPMVCADGFDGLTLPPVDHPVTGEVRIAAVGMAKDEIDKATEVKDVSLATAMGVGYGLGLLLLLCGSCGLWRQCRQRPVAGSAREVGDLAKSSAHCVEEGGNTTCEMAAAQIGAPPRNAPEEV